MKKIIIFSLYLFLAATLFNACRKKDNSKIPELTQVPVPVMVVDPSSDEFISPASPATFKTKFTIDKLFADDVTPQKVDIVVMKNTNTGNVKIAKENVSLPSTIEITGQDFINLFGPINGADKFDIGADITLANGQKLLAFPATGSSYASGVLTEIGNVKPGAVTTLEYLMPCPFVASAYNGNFVVVSDDWQDYAPGTVIPVTMVSATQISFKYNVDAGTAEPIIMTIDPANNAISVAMQFYGSYGGTPVYATSVAGAASTVNPCDISLSLRLKHTDASGATTYDVATIKLKKQ
jgi:hypothetical protein